MIKHILKAKAAMGNLIRRMMHLVKLAPWFTFLVTIAIIEPLLTNSKPIACKYLGQWYFPAFRDYSEPHIYYKPGHPLQTFALNNVWPKQSFERYTPALIPFTATDRDNQNLKVPPATGGHWLGTDATGHDVAAGLVSGARVALTISLIAVLAAAILGIGFGAVSGYFGDNQFFTSRWHLLITAGLWVAFTVVLYSVQLGLLHQHPGWWLAGWLAGVLVLYFFSAFGKSLIPTNAWLQGSVALPIDIVTQRLGELTSAFPKLILLTVIVAMLNQNPSLYLIALIAGAFSWPSIAAYVRAEMLKVRALNYIAAARLSGLSQAQVLLRHALPNALAPAWVALAFFAGSAILLETSLSFLGIRNSAEDISWGSLMLDARLYPTAWWLAIFPGLMITFTIFTFYRLAMRVSHRHHWNNS